MDHHEPETTTMFYMWLSTPRPKIDKVTSAIVEITTRNNQPRADLIEYLDYCNQVIHRTFQIVEECRNERASLSSIPDGDIAYEILSRTSKRIDSDEMHANVMKEIFERRITFVQRILKQRSVPAQQRLSSAKNINDDELTVHQVASRMQHDLNSKGIARTEDVVKVLGNPAKSVSVTPPTKN